MLLLTEVINAEIREKIVSAVPLLLLFCYPEACLRKRISRLDWPEGWRSTRSAWMQKGAIHPCYLQGGGEVSKHLPAE